MKNLNGLNALSGECACVWFGLWILLLYSDACVSCTLVYMQLYSCVHLLIVCIFLRVIWCFFCVSTVMFSVCNLNLCHCNLNLRFVVFVVCRPKARQIIYVACSLKTFFTDKH